MNNYWCLIDVLIDSFDISIDPVIWEGWHLIHMWKALGQLHHLIFIDVPVPSQQKVSGHLFCVGGYRCASFYNFDIIFRNCSNTVVFCIFHFMTFANSQERESEQILNLLLSEEATTFKARSINLNVFYSEKYWKRLDCRTNLYISSPLARSIALYSALKVELAYGNRRQSTRYRSYSSHDVNLRSIKQPI